MQGTMKLPENANKIFVFDDVYPLSAATEQASKKKLSAFGFASKLNPFKRPKDETVLLTKHVQRYEPFWHFTTSRAVDFSREMNYPIDIGNAYATKVIINGNEFAIAEKSGKRKAKHQYFSGGVLPSKNRLAGPYRWTGPGVQKRNARWFSSEVQISGTRKY